MMWRASMREFARRDLLVRIGQAVRIGEDRFGQADLARALGHLARRTRLRCRRCASASTMQASLADWMIMPCSRSSTGTLLCSAANMVEPCDGAPPLRQAFSLTTYSSVELDAALLDLVEHVFRGHQLGEARREDQLVGVALEQHAAVFRVDQDRVRRGDLPARPSSGAGHCFLRGAPAPASASAADEAPAARSALNEESANAIADDARYVRR